MIRRLAVLLVLVVSFGSFAQEGTPPVPEPVDPPKQEDTPHDPSGPRPNRTEDDSKRTEIQKEQIEFLEKNFPLSGTYVEGYRKNIAGSGFTEEKDFLSGQEVAELLFSVEGKTLAELKVTWGKLKESTLEKIKAVEGDPAREDLTDQEKAAVRFYKKFLAGLDYELKDKKWDEPKLSAKFNQGYEDGRKDKLAFAQDYTAALEKMKTETLTDKEYAAELKNLEKHRVDKTALLNYGQAKYWKSGNRTGTDYTSPASAIRMAATPDAEGRLFVTLKDKEGVSTAYYAGTRAKDEGGAAANLARNLADWDDSGKPRALADEPWSKAKKVVLFGEGDKKTEWAPEEGAAPFKTAQTALPSKPFSQPENVPDVAKITQEAKTVLAALGTAPKCAACHNGVKAKTVIGEADASSVANALSGEHGGGDQMSAEIQAIDPIQKKALQDFANTAKQ